MNMTQKRFFYSEYEHQINFRKCLLFIEIEFSSMKFYPKAPKKITPNFEKLDQWGHFDIPTQTPIIYLPNGFLLTF